MPTVLLGDHGFLRKYGSTMSVATVVERMTLALSQASMGLSAGDERCLAATRRAIQRFGSEAFVLHHTDVGFTCAGKESSFPRSMATVRRLLQASAPVFLKRDPLVGAFVDRYARYRPYAETDRARVALNERTWERARTTILRFRPAAVSVGGDYLDALLAIGGFDLASMALSRYAKLCNEVGASLLVTTYIAPLVDGVRFRESVIRHCDGVMAPINPAGIGMAPERDALLAWLADLHCPSVAMHPLGAGRLDVRESLDFIFDQARASNAVIGASQVEHICALAEVLRRRFGTSTSIREMEDG